MRTRLLLKRTVRGGGLQVVRPVAEPVGGLTMPNKKKSKEVVKRGVAGGNDDLKEEYQKAGSPFGDTPEGEGSWINESMGTAGNIKDIDVTLDTARNPDVSR